MGKKRKMKKKEMERRILALEAAMREVRFECRRHATCVNYAAPLVKWRGFKPLEPNVFEKMKEDAYKGNLFMDTHITCEGKGEAEE